MFYPKIISHWSPKQTEKSLTLGSTDNAGTSVNLVSGITRSLSDGDSQFASETNDRFNLSLSLRKAHTDEQCPETKPPQTSGKRHLQQVRN